MEILREGKEVPSYVFSCERCGCIWRAKEGEYVEIRGWEDGVFVPIYKGLFNVFCKCTNCKKEAMMRGRYKEYFKRSFFRRRSVCSETSLL